MGNESGSSSKETVPNENLSPQVEISRQKDRQLLDKCASHERSNEDMMFQLATPMTKNEELSDVYLQLVKYKKTYDELTREKSSLNIDYKFQRELNDFLLEQYTLHKRSDEDMKSQLQTLRQRNGVLESKKVSLNKDNARLRQEKDVLHSMCVSYERSDEDTKSQLQTLRQRNGILESEKVSLNRDNAHLRQEKDTLHDKCVSYERSDEDMKSQLQALRQRNGILESEKVSLHTDNARLRQENDTLHVMSVSYQRNVAQIATLLSRNKELAADNLHLKGSRGKLSEKCTKLKTCNKNLISQLSDNEFVQVLGQMLEIRKNIDEVEGDNSLNKETKKLKGQISKKKDEKRKLEDELQRKSYELTNHNHTRQLIHAEIELEATHKDICNFLTRRQQCLSSITENIQKYTEELASIPTSVDKIKTKLKNYSEKLVKLRNEGEDLKKQQQKHCETILALLDKQNDAMKILMTLSDADRNQSDVKRYAIQILNLKESNAYEDYRIVLDIINSVHAVPEEDIEVRRLGDSRDGTRPIVVYLPSIEHVRKILSASRKLKNSKYPSVQIAPAKKREETPPQGTSATFSYELA